MARAALLFLLVATLATLVSSLPTQVPPSPLAHRSSEVHNQLASWVNRLLKRSPYVPTNPKAASKTFFNRRSLSSYHSTASALDDGDHLKALPDIPADYDLPDPSSVKRSIVRKPSFVNVLDRRSSKWPKGKYISSAYYPDWSSDIMPPSKVDMSLFDLIFFAFAIPTKSYGLQFTQDNSAALLTQLVKKAHKSNSKVVVAIGGWTDSTYFSKAVSSRKNRRKFIKNIHSMVKKYKVDGVDIDWEYPGGGGESSNYVSKRDTKNFLLFIKGLRKALGHSKHISVCTTQQPFLGSNGSPVSNVAEFAKFIDNVMVMNYDVWGASSTPGPNAPLSDACSGSNQPNANEASAISSWTSAGMPAHKIIMGVPSYGYISSSTKTTLIHRRSENNDNAEEKRSNVFDHAGTKVSPLHRWYLESERQSRNRRSTEDVHNEKKLQKRDDEIRICPNDHSHNPCGGESAGQDIKSIDWNPLNVTDNSDGTVTVQQGQDDDSTVFSPEGAGVGKLGDGSLAAIDGNQIQFYQLISYGVVKKSGTSYKGINGYTRKWDTCSSTPYLYDQSRKVVITYDDPQSLKLKAKLAKKKKLAGIAMWDISGDTSSWVLVKSFRSGLGL